jgi:hypothetical protein
MTYCSQCGGEMGPGNHGFSHCSDHQELRKQKEAQRATTASTLKVITDNKPRSLVSFKDLPPSTKEDFEYTQQKLDDEIDERFVLYKGNWYDTKDIQPIHVRRDGDDGVLGWALPVDEDHPFASWDSMLPETYFTGVLFKMWDYDHVVCGRYTS